MVAHYHGQVWNAAEPARSLGIGETSVRRYLDLLSDVFMLRQLQPWFTHITKRQIKAPRCISGIRGYCTTCWGSLPRKNFSAIRNRVHPGRAYVIEEVLRIIEPEESYFWGTHGGPKIDLVLRKRRKNVWCRVQRS